MIDIAGKEISVGHKVAITVSGYECLRVATVIGFTPKKVKVDTGSSEYTKFPDQVAVIGHVKD